MKILGTDNCTLSELLISRNVARSLKVREAAMTKTDTDILGMNPGFVQTLEIPGT